MILTSDAFAASRERQASREQKARFSIAGSSKQSEIKFQGCQSRTQRPQFQPRLLLQCQPAPQPSATISTTRATPICNKGGLGDIGLAYVSTVMKVTKTTIIAVITRSKSPTRSMQVTL
jgi:hypothetical protein